jgi:hypothetical protein
MAVEVSRMEHADIDGAIDTIQQAFAEDPYNNWIYPDKSKVLIFYLPKKCQNHSFTGNHSKKENIFFTEKISIQRAYLSNDINSSSQRAIAFPSACAANGA